ncbi:MAG: SMC-Scp complex subunit ScpB [Coprococcus sp.]
MNNEDLQNEEIDEVNTPSEENEEARTDKEYSDDYLTSAIEAILFSVGESVSIDRLSSALEMDKRKLTKQLEGIIYNYNNSDRGIRIIDLDGSLQLCTRNEYYGILAKVVNTPKKLSLTDVVLETLSIIAYKQPITRPEIEAIRGVSCVHAINKLIEYNLVQEVGRLDAPGRPIMFGTTEEFLRCFGVSSTNDLPMISPDKIEDFKKEALEEADFTLSVDTTSEE